MRIIDDRPADLFPQVPQPGDSLHVRIGDGQSLPVRVLLAERRGDLIHIEAEIPRAVIAGWDEPMAPAHRRRSRDPDGGITAFARPA